MRRNRLSVVAAVAFALGMTGSVAAREHDEELPNSRIGIAAEAGGGALGFTRGQLADVTGVGGSWAVRLILDTRWYLGGEIAYFGSANQINVAGIATSAQLIGSGIEGALRIQGPIPIGRNGLIEPYILGGLGWTRFDLATGSGTLDQFTSGDNGLAIPVGGGILFGIHHFLVDLRAVYRFGFFNNPVLADHSTGSDNWSFNALVGYEF